MRHLNPAVFVQVDQLFAKCLHFEASLTRALSLPQDCLIRRGIFQVVAKGKTFEEMDQLEEEHPGQPLLIVLLTCIRRRLKTIQERGQQLLEEWQQALDERTVKALAEMEVKEKVAAKNVSLKPQVS